MNKELKVKIKEFTKKHFIYNQTDKKISFQIKQELERLGAFKPFYADSENERSIRLTNMLNSDNEEIKNIVLKEVKEHFSINNAELINEIKTYQSNLEERMRKMKEAREKKKYE